MYNTTFKDTTIFVLYNTQQYCNFHHITRYCNPKPDIAIPICNWGLHLSLSSPFENGGQVLEQVMWTMPSRVPSKASSDNIPPQDKNPEERPSKDLTSSDDIPPLDENLQERPSKGLASAYLAIFLLEKRLRRSTYLSTWPHLTT
jgi:hypothetical protein